MTKISLLKIVESTTVNGPGFRTSEYSAGCVNACPGCHNPQSWDITHGIMTDVEVIANKILADDLCNVTFSGGDPMFQPLAFAELARIIKERSNKDIWCYTGYTYERIIKDEEKSQLLKYVDVLVDGPFVQSLRNEDLLFRGSSNQRLIDVQKSLKAGHVELFEYNPFPEFVTHYLN